MASTRYWPAKFTAGSVLVVTLTLSRLRTSPRLLTTTPHSKIASRSGCSTIKPHFEGIIQPGEFFDVSVCNPPFHGSLDEALKGSLRKLNNLARNRGEQNATTQSPTLNFGGLGAELWCKGGEQLFLKKLIRESQTYSTQCRWFSSLVSKADNVKPAKKLIGKLGAVDSREIEMRQGNKVTRVLAWTFM